MKLAIMQPYFFPYIGYFQLIKAVDKFVAYDDVTYIKQGWINRNRILANGAPLIFSVPLSGAGSHVLIRDVKINMNLFSTWRTKFFKTVEQYYKKAPQYEQVLPLLQDVLVGQPTHISHLALHSVKLVCSYLDIGTEIIETAVKYDNSDLKSEERVIDICCQELADIYINAAGGKELYLRDNFKMHGIDLQFIKSKDVFYNQYKTPFVPWLSIIDVMMFNSPETIHHFLCEYELV